MRSKETIVPCRRAACIASSASAAVSSESAPKTPPQWNQRAPSAPKIRSQSTSPGRSFDAAECARSEQPRAGPDAEAAFGEVEPVAHLAPDAVVRKPAEVRLLDAALVDQILDQAADGVVGERGHDRRAQAEAALERAGDVVLAAALADVEAPGRRDAAVAGVEAQHDLAQRDEVPAALVSRAQDHRRELHRLACEPFDLVEAPLGKQAPARRASFRRTRARTGRRGRSGARTAPTPPVGMNRASG